jgi:hypothetical protein
VDQVGNDFLPGSGLAQDEHGAFRGADRLDAEPSVVEGGATEQARQRSRSSFGVGGYIGHDEQRSTHAYHRAHRGKRARLRYPFRVQIRPVPAAKVGDPERRSALLEACVSARDASVVDGDLGGRLAPYGRDVRHFVGTRLCGTTNVHHHDAESRLAIVGASSFGGMLGDGAFCHAGILYQGRHS